MKVSILYRGSLKQLNGASSVVRLFDENKQVFCDENIEFGNMFTYDCVNPKSYKETRGVGDNEKPNHARSLKSTMIARIQRTYLGSCFSIDWLQVRRAKNVINMYMKSAMDENALIIHDILTCYEYLTKVKKSRKKIILVNHNSGLDWQPFLLYFPKLQNSNYYRRLVNISRFCYEKVDRIVFVSEMSKRLFINNEGKEYAEKAVVIHNGVNDIPYVGEKDFSTIRMVTVGTVNERKNQLNMIKCINELGDRNISLTIVGDGSKYDECNKYVTEHHMESTVKLLGKRFDVVDILNDHNVFIMTSLEEGLPMAAIEALRSGLPLLLTDVGGCRELIDGNGLLMSPNNTDIIRSIMSIIDNPKKLKEYSLKSREIFLKQFEAHQMIALYCNLLKQIL